MEKCNSVTDDRTPCKICQEGRSEHICDKCRNTKCASDDACILDTEKLAEEHK